MDICILAAQSTFLQTQISFYFHSVFLIPLSPTALRETLLQPHKQITYPTHTTGWAELWNFKNRGAFVPKFVR